MSLHYLVKLEVLIAHVVYVRGVTEKKTPQFIPP